MTQVALRCPVCKRGRVYNGRGRCACGAYLVDHIGRSFIIDPDNRENYWLHRDGKWVNFVEYSQQHSHTHDKE